MDSGEETVRCEDTPGRRASFHETPPRRRRGRNGCNRIGLGHRHRAMRAEGNQAEGAPDDKVEVVAFDYVDHAKVLSQPDADRPALIHAALEKFLSRNDVSKDLVVVSVPGQHTLRGSPSCPRGAPSGFQTSFAMKRTSRFRSTWTK